MAKDFRAKQVRTQKIIGRSDDIFNKGDGQPGSKIQLALMKSGSADFAGGVLTSQPHNNGATPGDVGRLKNIVDQTDPGTKIGTDVWMVVDGNSSKKYTRSPGETVLFLGDVFVSGTLYTERMRTVIHTQQVTSNTDHSFVTSGSIFVNERSGISVGKTVLYNKEATTMTDPRGSDLASSVFWAGNNQGANADDYGENNSNPDPLLFIKPSGRVSGEAAAESLGRIGIGTSSPTAKLEIFAPVGTGTADATKVVHQFKITHSTDDHFGIQVNDNGSTTLSTQDAGDGVEGHIKLDADGGIVLDSTTGNLEFRDDTVLSLQIQHDTSNEGDAVFKDGGGQEIFRIDHSQDSILMETSKKIEFHDQTAFMHAHAAGKLTIDAGSTAADAIVLNSSGGVDITAAGDNGSVNINATEASNFSVATNAAEEDLTIALTGDTDSSIHISSTGTGADAITMSTSAGGMDITVAGAVAGEDLDITANSSINITSTEQVSDAIVIHSSGVGGGIDIQASGGENKDIDITNVFGSVNITAGEAQPNAINIEANSGGIDIDADQGYDVDIQGGQILVTSKADANNTGLADAIKLLTPAGTGGGAADTIAITNMQGTGATAINITATAGGMDIGAANAITIDTTSADGHIAITSAHTAGDSILISANADAGAVLDVDAGIMDVDVQGAYTLDATGISLGSDAASNFSVNTGGGNAVDLTLSVDGGGDSSLIMSSTGTGDDSLQVTATAGGMDITSAGALDITTSAGNSNITIDPNGTGTLTLGSDDNTEVEVNAARVDVNAGDSGFTITGAGANNFLETQTSGKNVTVRALGGGTQQLQLVSAGTGTDAIFIEAQAGGIDVDSQKAITVVATDEDINITADADNAKVRLKGDNLSGVSIHLQGDAAAASTVDIDAGILQIDSKNTTHMIMTADDNSTKELKIDAINSNAGGSAAAVITIGATDGTAVNIGHSTSEVTVGQNLTVVGNLTVNGTTTQLNTAQLLVEDRVIQLSKGDAADADVNQGFIFTRATANLGGDSDKEHGALYFQGSDSSGNGLFILGVTADDGTAAFSAGGPADDDLSDLKIGKLLIDGTTNHIDAPGDLVITAAQDVTFTVGGGSVTPTANGGAALGTAAKSWSNLYLAESGQILFGDDSEITLTHSPDSGLLLKHVGTTDGKMPTLTFQAGDNDIAANDELGVINFQAPDETEGTDAILVAAGIAAVAEGDFAVDRNRTKLSFRTGFSETAYEKMALDGLGNLHLKAGGRSLMFGSTGEVKFTHVHNTGLLLNDAMAIQFGDAASNIKQVADGQLEIESDVSIQVDAPIVDFEDDGVVLQFGENDDVTLTHVHNEGLLLNNAMQLQFGDSASHIKQVADGQLEIESDVSIQIDSPVVDFEDDGVILQFGDGDDVTLTHVHNEGLLLNSGKQIQFGHADESISGDGTDLTFKSANDFVFDASSAEYPAIRLKSSPNAAIKQPQIILERIDGAIASGDHLGMLSFGGREGAAADVIEGARIDAKATGDFSIASPQKIGSSELAFHTRFNNALFQRMVISSVGSVGIGVEDPDTRLEVLSTATQQKWSYDADSFATITVADDSHTTLATGESGDFTIDAGGDIILDALSGGVGGKVKFLASGTQFLEISKHGDDTRFRNSAGTLTFVLDESESSLLMFDARKLQFREATTFIHSPGANTLDIETGTDNNGVINIGTDEASTITIGKAGVTSTTIHGLSLGSINISGATGQLKFDDGDGDSNEDPIIKRNAGGQLLFSDVDNTTPLTLTALNQNNADDNAFVSLDFTAGAGGNGGGTNPAIVKSEYAVMFAGRGVNVINTTAAVATGNNHIDEITGTGKTTHAFFASGSVKPAVDGYDTTTDVAFGGGTDEKKISLAGDTELWGTVNLRGTFDSPASRDETLGKSPDGYGMTVDYDGVTIGNSYYWNNWHTGAGATASDNKSGSSLKFANTTRNTLAFKGDAEIRLESSKNLEITKANGTGPLVAFDPNSATPTIAMATDAELQFGASTQKIVGDASNNLNLSADGNIGIKSNIEIDTGSDASIIVAATPSGTPGRDLTIAAGSTATGTANNSGGSLILKGGDADGVGISSIIFQTSVTMVDAAQEIMRIKGDSVGINTSSPGESLDVVGNIQTTGNVIVGDSLVHKDDTNNKILFGTDSQTFQTGGAIRADINDSGFRLGAAGARVTSIIPASSGVASNNNDTTLPTTAAVKTYVDAQVSGASPSGAMLSITALKNDSLIIGRTDSNDEIDFSTNDQMQFKINNSVKWRVASSSNISLQTLNMNHNNIDNVGANLGFSNTGNRVIFVGQTAAGTTGKDLTLKAGDTHADGTDIGGGDLILQSGGSTGTGSSAVTFRTPIPAAVSGTGLNSTTERMRIQANGNVGIGTTNPKHKLVVQGDDAVLRIGDNAGELTDGSGRLEIAEDSNADGVMTHGGYLEFDGNADSGEGGSDGQLILGVRDGNTNDVDVVKIDRDAPANSILITGEGVTINNLGTAATATNVTVADESVDTTCFPLFVTAATGDLAPKSGDNLTFNSNTGLLTATSLGGTLTTAAQTNITSVGTLSGLSVSGNSSLVGNLEITDINSSSATRGGRCRLVSDDGAAMASGHRLGVIEFAGAEDASNTITVGARIEALCDSAWSDTENGTDLLFYTTDGNASQLEKMRITAGGNVGIGTATPKHKLVVQGDDAVLRIGDNSGELEHGSGRLEIAEDSDSTSGAMTHGGYLKFDGDAVEANGAGQLILGVRDASTNDVDIIKIDRDAQSNSILITDAGVTINNLGSAATLTNARNIGGVAFDGSANIDLPGVNAPGNQNTSGNAATATKLAASVNIGGVSFDGSASINLPGVNASGNQDTSGNAATATKIDTITNSNIVQLGLTQTLTNKTIGAATIAGHMIPDNNNTYDLGSSANRFANIYTNDLNLCNEGRGNDVDGTSGNWTIQEGEDSLFVINNITGKKFKMMLQPVEDGE